MGNFIVQYKWKTKNKIGECHPEGHFTDPRNKRVEETSSEGGQGPERAVVP